jgi:hypothetical protein
MAARLCCSQGRCMPVTKWETVFVGGPVICADLPSLPVDSSRLQQTLFLDTLIFDTLMYKFCKWVVIGLVVCILAVRVVNASSVGFQSVPPDELMMKSEALAPGAAAIILYRQVDRDDSGQPTREDNYVRIKILTEEGRKYADVEIPFLKGRQDVVKVGARTIKPDGSIVEFTGRPFEKNLVKAKGVKYLAKTLTLPDAQVGSIIEYYYTMVLGDYIFDSHWILSNDLFTKKAQFSLKPYTYWPYRLRWSWHDLPPGAEPKEGHDHIVRMEASNIPAFQVEDYMPPPNEMRSRVDFI